MVLKVQKTMVLSFFWNFFTIVLLRSFEMLLDSWVPSWVIKHAVEFLAQFQSTLWMQVAIQNYWINVNFLLWLMILKRSSGLHFRKCKASDGKLNFKPYQWILMFLWIWLSSIFGYILPAASETMIM